MDDFWRAAIVILSVLSPIITFSMRAYLDHCDAKRFHNKQRNLSDMRSVVGAQVIAFADYVMAIEHGPTHVPGEVWVANKLASGAHSLEDVVGVLLTTWPEEYTQWRVIYRITTGETAWLQEYRSESQMDGYYRLTP